MELGKRLLQARLEAGLSQRQVCGDRITRNMLSQIEHGTATPSVATVQYLAERLGRPMSFFLGEDGELSPNRAIMESAREAYDRGNYARAARQLRGFREPDSLLCREWELLRILTALALAEQAITERREPYARELLEEAGAVLAKAAYPLPGLNRRRLLLLGRLHGANPQALVPELPELDEELRLRATAALAQGDRKRCARLLDAAENREDPDWCMLRGRVCLLEGNYRDAAGYFHKAEAACPREAAAYLEQCYRELGDFRQAYHYACRVRDCE